MKPLVGAFNKNCRIKIQIMPVKLLPAPPPRIKMLSTPLQLHILLYIYIWPTLFFSFNQGSSGGLPTLGIQDVLRAILVELDDWLKLVAYSSNPIHSFPQLNWQTKKKEKYPARTYAFRRKKKLMKIHTARLSYVQQLIFVTFWYAFLSPC